LPSAWRAVSRAHRTMSSSSFAAASPAPRTRRWRRG
jgi:hypothetical protein